MKTNKSLSSNVRIISSSVLSPHSKALYEVGKNILSGSIESGRDFCKTMTANCAGAIPIYIGILVFLLPADFTLGILAGITFALPCIGYLIAMILFTIGYMPYSSSLSLDIVEEIQITLEKLIAYRKKLITWGMIVFVISTLLSIFVIIINIGVK